MEEAAPPKGSFPFEYVRHEVGGARPVGISQVRTRGVDIGTGVPNRVDAVYRDFDTELVDVRRRAIRPTDAYASGCTGSSPKRPATLPLRPR